MSFKRTVYITEASKVPMRPHTRRLSNPGADEPLNLEHWKLAVEVEQCLKLAQEETDSLTDISIDLNDLLQAADKLRHIVAPQLISVTSDDRDELRKLLRAMAFEFEHIAFHAQAAVDTLDKVAEKLR
ncbi:hypothetical protein BH11ARM2_BH11ARM2_33450 [soil metagenome]